MRFSCGVVVVVPCAAAPVLWGRTGEDPEGDDAVPGARLWAARPGCDRGDVAVACVWLALEGTGLGMGVEESGCVENLSQAACDRSKRARVEFEPNVWVERDWADDRLPIHKKSSTEKSRWARVSMIRSSLLTLSDAGDSAI